MSPWMWLAVLGFPAWFLVFGSLLVRAVRRHRRVTALSRQLRRFRTRAQHTTGEIIDNQIESAVGRPELRPTVDPFTTNLNISFMEVPGPGGLLFRPIVQFNTSAGEAVRFVGYTPSTRSWVPSTKVPVSFDPDDPENAEITGTRPTPSQFASLLSVLTFTAFVTAGVLYLSGFPLAGSLTDPTDNIVSNKFLSVLVAASLITAAVGLLLALSAKLVTPSFQKHLYRLG
ncbi:DUF3592 domain-containing protein [Micromonosporaceae bacterium B7E4]